MLASWKPAMASESRFELWKEAQPLTSGDSQVPIMFQSTWTDLISYIASSTSERTPSQYLQPILKACSTLFLLFWIVHRCEIHVHFWRRWVADFRLTQSGQRHSKSGSGRVPNHASVTFASGSRPLSIIQTRSEHDSKK